MAGPLSWLGNEVKDIFTPGDLLNKGIDQGQITAGTEPVDPPKKDDAKSKAKTLPSPEKAVKDQTQSPYEQLANELAKQYLTQINQLQPLVSGESASGLEGEAGQGSQAQLAGLLSAAGIAPGSGLAKATEAPLTQTDPLQGNVNAAMQGVAAAQEPASVGYAKAVKDTGEANTQTLESAPWEQILQELASETAYRAASGTGAAAFGGTTKDTPTFLQQFFSQLGLGSVPGTTSSSGLPGTPTAVTKAAKGGSNTTVPSDSTNPSAP